MNITITKMFHLIHLLVLFPFIHGSTRIGPLVNTNQGLIRGLRAENGQYSMFLGVPYAVVDKANPFGRSTPHPIFENTFEAFDDSVVCPQLSKTGPIGSIDCLNLNIFIPDGASLQNPLPVMVWIHGGAYLEGSGNREMYSPEFLVRHDVIIVTLNYRLGPYGFLCLETSKISGNQGVKDQVLALRWVNDNIQYFGGDVNKITLFGESLGAHSVQLHILSQQEKLYHKAIIQSPPVLGRSRVTTPSNAFAFSISKTLGYETEDLDDALSFLANQSSHVVFATASELDFPSVTCIEKEYEGVDTVLSKSPYDIELPKVKNLPILIGFNNNEMLFLLANNPPEFFETYSFKSAFKGFNLVDDEVADTARHFFVGDEVLNENVKQEIIDFESDLLFNYPVDEAIKKYKNEGAGDIFYYVFSYDGDRNLFKIDRNITASGASHGDELGYLFGSELFRDQPTKEDQLVIDRITTLWTNFAKYGEPTPVTTDLLPVKWNPVTKTVQNYLEIGSNLTPLRRPFKERMSFWNLFFKIHEKVN